MRILIQILVITLISIQGRASQCPLTAGQMSPLKIDRSLHQCVYTQVFNLQFTNTPAAFNFVSGNVLMANGNFGTLEAEDINGDVHKYTAVSVKATTQSEHQFGDVAEDLELSIVFSDAGTGKMEGNVAVVSFLFSASSLATNNSPGLALTTGLSQNVDFGKIFPNNMLLSPPYSRYFYYTGASTITPCQKDIDYYVFETVFAVSGSEIAALQNLLQFNFGANTNSNLAKPLATNQVLKRGGCYPDYWTHDMNSNIAVWYMIPFLIIFFVFSLFVEQEVPHKDMVEVFCTEYNTNDINRIVVNEDAQLKTNHLLYSLYNASSAVFTRQSRCTLLLCCIMFQMLVESGLYWKTNNDAIWTMFAYPALGVVLSKIIQLLYGNLLYVNYEAQRLRWAAKGEERTKQFIIIQDLDFYFYFVSFFTIVGSQVLVCFFMYGQPNKIKWLWFSSTWIGFLMDQLIFETLFAAISSSMPGLCKRRGLYFDFMIYEDFYRKKLI